MLFEFMMALLLVLALLLIAPALLKKRRMHDLDRQQQNVVIARERLDEIAADHASGEMTDDVFEQVKNELEASLLDDVEMIKDKPLETEVNDGASLRAGRAVFVVLMLGIPLGAFGLYNHLGSPQYLDYTGANAGTMQEVEHMAQSMPSMDEMIARLEGRLENNPQDGDAWFMLAKTYMAEQVYDKALGALQKAREIFGDEPAILLGMADASAMLHDGNLTGKPAEYIELALKKDPDNVTGLWLGGMSAQQTGQFQLAIHRWLLLMPQLKGDVESLGQLKTLIGQVIEEAKAAGTPVDIDKAIAEIEARQPATAEQMPVAQAPQTAPAQTDEAVASAPVIKAWVSLDPALKAQVAPTDTLFVFAKAVSGPPMPLAAFKGTVADLPLEVTLDDSMAMMPQMRISAFERVSVSARIAKGGTPATRPGDITSEAKEVELNGTVSVELSLDSVVK